ncbi:MAG: hypothetical protein JNK67_27270 [Alphaproteobacteria bacterium]|nr:hypothetical protein [Alphaproteobacteria bacterium]
MRTRFQILSILAGAMFTWQAHAVPVPASATAIASASYSVNLSGLTVVDVITLPDTTTPVTSGAVVATFPIGPTLTSDCSAVTTCFFGGIVGGVAVAVDGTAALFNKLGGLGLVLFSEDGGSLTVNGIAFDTPTSTDGGAEPTGIAAAIASLELPIIDSDITVIVAAGESVTFAVGPGLHSLIWAGGQIIVAAERHLDAVVAEPFGLALVSLGSLVLLRRRRIAAA